MNYNQKNYKDIKYVTQEEINKMSHNEKFLPTCKCGKKEECRWKESDLSYHKGKGIFYPIKPFKGKSGEEVCHKCVVCDRCGKEAPKAYENRFYEYKITNDNPSGEWILGYCSRECLEGTKKKEQPKQTISCSHCGKLKEVNFVSNFSGRRFCSESCERAVGIKYDKVCCHSCSQLFELRSLSEEESEEGWCMSARNAEFYCSKICYRKWLDKWSHCSPSASPAVPSPQSITNSNDKSDKDTSKNITENNEKPQKTDNELARNKDNDNQAKPVKVIVDKGNDKETNSPPNSGSTSKENKEMLVIDLRTIKRIELTSDGKLVIGFNDSENNNYVVSQTIEAEQVNNNQELKTIKNYCQKSGKSSLSKSELNKIFSANDTMQVQHKPTDNKHTLVIGLSVAAALIFGLAIGLLLKRKKLREINLVK